MNDVRVIVEDSDIFVKTPYNADFVARAKRQHAGRWDATRKMWKFRARDERAVREMVTEFFGSDGSTALEVVDVLVTVGRGFVSTQSAEIVALGRRLVRKFERDSYPAFSPGVALHDGPDFPQSAGSRKHPIVSNGDTPRVLLVQDVPRPIAERAVSEAPNCFALLTSEDLERAALLRERARLLERLAELNDKLGTPLGSSVEEVEE